MNDLKKHTKIFRLKDLEIPLWIPDLNAVQLSYQQKKSEAAFPYWAKLWPAACVLTAFIQEHSELVKNKRVLELAAGLGLPSLLASRFASSVLCSDYDATAVQFIQMNLALNNITNMKAAQIDWTEMPSTFDYDVLLMSDINYDPTNFDGLQKLFHEILEKGVTILLSTPQRLVGKAFIAELLAWCILNEEQEYHHTAVNVMVLKK